MYLNLVIANSITPAGRRLLITFDVFKFIASIQVKIERERLLITFDVFK